MTRDSLFVKHILADKCQTFLQNIIFRKVLAAEMTFR